MTYLVLVDVSPHVGRDRLGDVVGQLAGAARAGALLVLREHLGAPDGRVGRHLAAAEVAQLRQAEVLEVALAEGRCGDGGRVVRLVAVGQAVLAGLLADALHLAAEVARLERVAHARRRVHRRVVPGDAAVGSRHVGQGVGHAALEEAPNLR